MSECAEEFDLGDDVRVSGEFLNTAGAAIDPTTVSFKFLPPGASSPTVYVYGTHVQLVKDSVGNYHVDIDANAAGLWKWRWISTGSGKAAEQGSFRVAEANIS